MEIKNRIAAAGLETAYRYLEKDPVQNLPKLMDWWIALPAMPLLRSAMSCAAS